MSITGACRECGREIPVYDVVCSSCMPIVIARRGRARAALARAFPTLDAAILNKLARAELSPDEIVSMADDDLLAIRNFGPALLARFRVAITSRECPISNWVGEGVPD